MIRSLKALIADYTRLAGVGTLFAALQYILWPWLFYTFVMQGMFDVNASQDSDSAQAPFTYYFSYAGMALIGAFTIGVMASIRMSKRNRLLPVSSRYLATWHWLSIIATVGLFNLVIQFSYWKIFDLVWPIATTTVAMCAMTAVLLGTGQWLRDCRIHRLAMAVLFVAATGYWCVRRLYGTEFSNPVVGCYQFLAVDYLVLTAIFWVSWSMMNAGYLAYRTGEPLKGSVLAVLTGQPLVAMATATGAETQLPNFKSPREAFLQMDWLRIRPISIGLFGGMLLGVGSLFWMLLRGTPQSLNGISPLFLMFSGVMAWLLGTIYAAGTDAHSSGQMNSLAASLPISDFQIGRFVTLSIWRCSVTTWASMQLAGLFVLLLSLPTILTPEFADSITKTNLFRFAGWASVPLLMVGSFCLSWLGCGLGASIALLTQRTVGSVFCGLIITTCIFSVGSAFGVPYAQQIGYGLLVVLAVTGCGLGNLYLMLFAFRKNLLSSQLFASCVTAALLICLLTVLLIPLDAYWKTVAAGFSMLAVLPFASIPTAMSWNRHR